MTDGVDSGHSKTLLVGFVKRVKSLADEIGDLQTDISEVCKEAKTAGFDSTKIREVVSWLRKVDKHGREKMDESEAIFDLYRSVADGGAVKLDEMMDSARDRALLKMFAGEDQIEKKLDKRRQTMRAALAMAQAAKSARDA
ncbi:GapR family DNA-binding domain-containing protein [Sphingomonas sp. KC8]|uniref:GapR family DNA-binding domain-containing protein n=1 Tax=Sphingomonas sp. KC8 TaxID=1030157 RepID=UPI00024893A1|nr:GapR family DNA-binding domain-containing protein [Sphingomonas sp. KC8]ARS29065.1 hypothetical protein KC8_17485 [Sphingomonas sp. KC8]